MTKKHDITIRRPKTNQTMEQAVRKAMIRQELRTMPATCDRDFSDPDLNRNLAICNDGAVSYV